MKKTTAVIAYKCDDGLYRRGEIFIHTSIKNGKKIFGMVTDGFEDYIQISHITTDFFDYITIMFGVEDYIFVFNENSYIYIYEVTDSKNYECSEKMEKNGPEMKKFIENHKEYFDE